MSFANKVVLITGGAAGIGQCTAEVFAKECASVAIADRNMAKLKDVAKCLENLGVKALAIEADVSKDKETDVIVQKTIDKFGQLDILVNNAGVQREAGIFEKHFLQSYDETDRINMRGSVRVTYFAAPHLVKTKGNIINIASIAGLSTTRPLNIAYRTSKAAMHHFTRSVALELAPHGVRVNSISPGPVMTSLFDGLKIDFNALKGRTALQRLSKPREIADMILFVASDKAIGITGSDFLIDNGTLLLYK